MKKDVSAQIAEIVRAHLPPRDGSVRLDADSSLADLGLDSLGKIDLVLDVENAFGVFVPDERLEPQHWATVGTITRVVSELLRDGEARAD